MCIHGKYVKVKDIEALFVCLTLKEHHCCDLITCMGQLHKGKELIEDRRRIDEELLLQSFGVSIDDIYSDAGRVCRLEVEREFTGGSETATNAHEERMMLREAVTSLQRK